MEGQAQQGLTPLSAADAFVDISCNTYAFTMAWNPRTSASLPSGTKPSTGPPSPQGYRPGSVRLSRPSGVRSMRRGALVRVSAACSSASPLQYRGGRRQQQVSWLAPPTAAGPEASQGSSWHLCHHHACRSNTQYGLALNRTSHEGLCHTTKQRTSRQSPEAGGRTAPERQQKRPSCGAGRKCAADRGADPACGASTDKRGRHS